MDKNWGVFVTKSNLINIVDNLSEGSQQETNICARIIYFCCTVKSLIETVVCVFVILKLKMWDMLIFKGSYLKEIVKCHQNVFIKPHFDSF